MLWYSSRAVKHKNVANIDDIAPSNEAHNSDTGHTSLKHELLAIVPSKKFEIACDRKHSFGGCSLARRS